MFDTPDLTPRGIAKFVVTTTVQVKTAMLTRQFIANHTALETTNTPVVVGGALVGLIVSEKVKPFTDKAVDQVADYIIEKRDERRDRKSKENDK